jgi:hypothetical protein
MSEKKTQLHEILAVESGLKTAAKNIVDEAKKTFANKQGLFDGFTKNYKARDEDDKEEIIGEVKHVQTNVPAKLDYVQEHLIRLFDCIAEKEKANTLAKADVVLDNGEVLLEAVPATMLLQLESQLKEVRDVFMATLTLDPAQRWKESNQEENIWETEIVKSVRSRKVTKPIVLYAHTEQHPAQVQMVSEDVQVGDWETIYKSGKITPLKKSQMLARLDELQRAVKKARMRANTQEVEKVEIGKKIFNFIRG